MALASFVRGYFDGLVEPMFQRDAAGRELFFPFGLYSRGRLVPDAATGRRLRTTMKVLLGGLVAVAAAAPSLIIFQVLTPWIFAAVLAGIVALQLALTALVARGLERTDQRMTVASQVKSLSTSFSDGYIRTMIVIGAILTVASAATAFAPSYVAIPANVARPIGAISAIFFGAVTVMWIAIAARKRRAA